MESNDKDYVSLVRIPRKWFYVFARIFSSLVILNLLLEVFLGWKLEALGATLLTRTSVLMALIVGFFFICSHLLEEIMFGYAKLFKDRVYAEGKAEGIAEGKAEGIAEGKAEGIAEGKVEGFQMANQAWVEWFQRKEAAEAAGEPFDEPSPAEQHQNGGN